MSRDRATCGDISADLAALYIVLVAQICPLLLADATLNTKYDLNLWAMAPIMSLIEVGAESTLPSKLLVYSRQGYLRDGGLIQMQGE